MPTQRDKRAILNQLGHSNYIEYEAIFRVQSLILEVLVDIRDSLQPTILEEDKPTEPTGNERPFPV